MNNQYFAYFISITFSFFIFSSTQLVAGEGMWMPHFLKTEKEKEMKSLGLLIDADKIYSETSKSIKDAIVHFGGGCTGEIISDQGLLITNHHCGFDYIQKQSTLEKDYLKNGFWAKDKSKELPNPGLTVSIIQSTLDVTDIILSGISDTTSEFLREKIIKENTTKIEKEKSINGLTAFVKSFNNGGQYFLYSALVFKDVRLVGAPSSAIGKFGEDSDNWMWPRHTGDFSLFRIYVDKNNLPAEYSPDNIPYKPQYVIPISMDGVKEKDFTFVYGFPGRTTEYLSSNAVEFIKNVEDPAKVKLRTLRLNSFDTFMKTNDTIQLKYASKYSSVSNGWKKWQGELLGLSKLNAIEKKKIEEGLLKEYIKTNNKTEYATLFDDLDRKYKEIEPLATYKIYYNESFLAIESFSYIDKLSQYISKIKELKDDKIAIAKESEKMKIESEKFFKDFSLKVDMDVMKKLLPEFFNGIKSNKYSMELSEKIDKQMKPDFSKIASRVSQTPLLNKDSVFIWLGDIQKNISRIQKDEVYIFTNISTSYFNQEIKPSLTKLEIQVNTLNRKLIKLKREVNAKPFYPDANGTLRVTFGNVEGYNPRNAVNYNFYTTIDGIFEKAKMGNLDYIIDTTLQKKYFTKDFQKYVYPDNQMRVAFIANNHTTGGNSGSPVFNAKGELVGTNYDRNWEGTMSDIMYDPSQTRNISLDIHYTLFIIDKIGNVPELIKEMNIVGGIK